jgi:hypothetical protein
MVVNCNLSGVATMGISAFGVLGNPKIYYLFCLSPDVLIFAYQYIANGEKYHRSERAILFNNLQKFFKCLQPFFNKSCLYD